MDIAMGLAGYWPMNASDVVGSTVADVSGNGHVGALVGSPPPVVVAGHIAEALDYSGAGTGYVDVPSLSFDAMLGVATTVSFWYWRPGPLSNDELVTMPATNTYDVWLKTNGTVAYLCINTGNGECWGIQDDSLFDRWVHVAAILRNGDEKTSELYVDGVRRAVACVFGTCATIRTVAGPVAIGSSDTVNDYNGLLDDVRIHMRALTGAEIAALYSGSACGQ